MCWLSVPVSTLDSVQWRVDYIISSSLLQVSGALSCSPSPTQSPSRAYLLALHHVHPGRLTVAPTKCVLPTCTYFVRDGGGGVGLIIFIDDAYCWII